jgi:hypothetical protein
MNHATHPTNQIQAVFRMAECRTDEAAVRCFKYT